MRYFFNFKDSTQAYADTEGEELLDLDSAREQGRLSARELMSLDKGEPDLTYIGAIFEITDAEGLLLHTVRFDEKMLEAVQPELLHP
jgi:hypothetical protein